MKKSKLNSVTAVLLAFVLIGVILIGIGTGAVLRDKKYTETAESTKAYVSSVLLPNGSRQYVLWYIYDGETYQPEYNLKKDDYIGLEKTVYFTKDAPEEIFIETEAVYYILLYAGIALSAVSAVVLITVRFSVKKQEYILKNGTAVQVRIKKIIDVIGGSKIICDSGKIRGKNASPFTSKTIKGRLSRDIINTSVTVYYLPKHKGIYYIDTDKIKDGAK